MPSLQRRWVPGTSGPSCEASQFLEFVLLVGQTHSPTHPPASLPAVPLLPSLAFLALPACCIRQTPSVLPSQLAVPASLVDLQGQDQVEFNSDP